MKKATEKKKVTSRLNERYRKIREQRFLTEFFPVEKIFPQAQNKKRKKVHITNITVGVNQRMACQSVASMRILY